MKQDVTVVSVKCEDIGNGWVYMYWLLSNGDVYREKVYTPLAEGRFYDDNEWAKYIMANMTKQTAKDVIQ